MSLLLLFMVTDGGASFSTGKLDQKLSLYRVLHEA